MGQVARGGHTLIRKDNTMYWKSFGDFLHMGGYGLYVWGSYGVTLLVMSVEALMGRQRFWAARQAINNLEQGK